MDGALGFNTFEKQDKVLVGLNGGMDAAVTVRILGAGLCRTGRTGAFCRDGR